MQGIHYNDIIIGAMASQMTGFTIVYSTVYAGEDQRKHQNSASLAFVRGMPRWPVNSPHKGPVTRKMFPSDDVIMNISISTYISTCLPRLNCHWLSVPSVISNFWHNDAYLKMGWNDAFSGDSSLQIWVEMLCIIRLSLIFNVISAIFTLKTVLWDCRYQNCHKFDQNWINSTRKNCCQLYWKRN